MGLAVTTRLTAAGAAAAGILVLAPAAAVGRDAAQLPMNVQFTATGQITVALGNGTPVGTTSGTPPQIPAGYYLILLTGPGGCAVYPHFQLNGPGESISDNLTEGETDNVSYNAYLAPNSTYTWRSDAAPSVVYTFTTGPTVMGSPPSTGPLESSKHTVGTSTSFVGSAVATFRGKLTAVVTAGGKLSLAFDGKTAKSLRAGRYTVAVSDRSKTSGFMLLKAKRSVDVSGVAWTGKRSLSVTLTAGSWAFAPTLKGAKTSVAVH
jgi:hypothetical protein